MNKDGVALLPREEILPIIGYEGLYSITSFGRVWSHLRYRKYKNIQRKCGGKFLKSGLNKDGYLHVILYKNNKQKTHTIHRLVAIAFIPNPDNLPEVNHKDGVKINCRKDNLEWCTKEENEYHAMENGLKPKESSIYYGVFYYKDLEHRKKPWVARTTVNKKRIHIGCYKTEIEAARAYNDFVTLHNLNRPLNNLENK